MVPGTANTSWTAPKHSASGEPYTTLGDMYVTPPRRVKTKKEQTELKKRNDKDKSDDKNFLGAKWFQIPSFPQKR